MCRRHSVLKRDNTESVLLNNIKIVKSAASDARSPSQGQKPYHTDVVGPEIQFSPEDSAWALPLCSMRRGGPFAARSPKMSFVAGRLVSSGVSCSPQAEQLVVPPTASGRSQCRVFCAARHRCSIAVRGRVFYRTLLVMFAQFMAFTSGLCSAPRDQ